MGPAMEGSFWSARLPKLLGRTYHDLRARGRARARVLGLRVNFGYFGISDLGARNQTSRRDAPAGFQLQVRRLDQGTDPLIRDTDLDGLPDGWEVSRGTAPRAPDADQDPDADTLANAREYALGSHPLRSDSEGDGMPDKYEVEF